MNQSLHSRQLAHHAGGISHGVICGQSALASQAKSQQAQRFGVRFAIFPTADFPAQLNPFLDVIEGVIQNITGMLPSVFGDMPAGLTLGQARMMLNQGLMQLGTVANNATHFYEDLFTNGVYLYLDVATVNPEFKGQQIDLDLIRQSAWTIKGGTVMPRTFAERQTELVQMIQQTPQLAQQLKVFDPVNFDKLTAYLDLPDLKNPDLDAMEAIKDIIDQLWQGEPIQQPPPMDPMGQPSGPPPPPQPSIDFDPLVFDPQMTVSLCRASLLEPVGQQRANTPGYQNVRAFLQAAQQAGTPPPPPPPPPKLSLSLQLDKAPAEQEMAVLNKFGIDTPFPSSPSMDATNHMEKEVHNHALHGPKNPPPNPAGPSPVDDPLSLVQPGNSLPAPTPMPQGVM